MSDQTTTTDPDAQTENPIHRLIEQLGDILTQLDNHGLNVDGGTISRDGYGWMITKPHHGRYDASLTINMPYKWGIATMQVREVQISDEAKDETTTGDES